MQRIIRLVAVLMAGVLAGGCAHVAAQKSRMPAKAGHVPILLYHHVARLPAKASRAQQRWTLSPEKFEAQVQWIAAHGFHAVTMSQLIAHIRHGQALPPKPIALSFDDGWKDQYAEAFPILKKYNFPATFFITTDSVGHSAYMQWKQVQEMSAAGMDIQPHSVTHRRLLALSHEAAWREITESKKMLESRLHKPARVFAYPFGRYDDALIAMVKDAGFEGAAAINGFNCGYIFRKDQSYALVRYAVEGNDNLQEIARVKGFGS